MNESEKNQLKRDYENAQRNASTKRNEMASLERQKQQLSQDQSNLNQLDNLDNQIKYLRGEVANIEKEVRRIEDISVSQGVELRGLIEKRDQQAADIAKAKAETAKNDQWLSEIDGVLEELSDFTGQRIDTTAMVVKALPKPALKDSKALMVACEKKSKEAFDELLSKMEDINAVDNNGMSLLLYSLKHGFTYGVEKLLERSVDVNVADSNGYTALMYACTLPHMKYTQKIIEAVSPNQINKKNPKDGNTALHVLCKNTGVGEIFYDEIKLIQQASGDTSNDLHFTGTLVINENAVIGDIIVGGRENDGYTVNQYKSLLICRKLKEKSADFTILNNEGFSPYFYLCLNQQKYIVNSLESEKIMNIDSLDDSGFQGAMGKLLLRDYDKLKDFISKHPKCLQESTKNHGETLLHLAIQMQDLELVKLVTNLGIDINSQDIFGRTPMYLSCLLGNKDILTFLHSKGADINILSNGFHPIHAAVHNGYTDVIQKLLELGVSINYPSEKGVTPLYYYTIVAPTPSLEVIKFLLDHGADPNISDSAGHYPLVECMAKDNLEVMNILLSYSITDINKRSVDDNKITTLWMAAQDGKEKFIDALLSKGADINIPRESNLETPIHVALKKGHVKAFNKLMDRTDVNASAVDINGQSILHYGAQLNKQEVVKLAIDRGIDINSQDNSGKTAAYFSCLLGNKDMLTFLHSKGADINILSNGFHPIHGAVHNSHTNVIEKLLELGVDVNCKSENGITPLHYYLMAIPEAKLDTVEFLISKGADLNVVNGAGSNPLHSAIHHCRFDIVKELVDRGADVNAYNNDKKIVTPLYYSMGYGGQEINTEIFDYLLSHGTDPNIAIFDGDTAMHMAGYKGRCDLAKKLLANGADINAVNHEKQTPLYVCIKQEESLTNEEKIKTIKYFLAKGAKVETETETSIFDLANQHLAEANDILQHPETVPSYQDLEVELFGNINPA